MKYVIQPSDSISSIAKKFRVSEESIIKENNDITDSNVLIVGETITVPVNQEENKEVDRQIIGSTPCPTLRIGSRGSDVARLQQLLLTNGFNPGPIDGIFGSRTDAAVRSFQAARGLVVDGIVGVQTWTALGVNCETPPPPKPGTCPTLRIGSRGPDVIRLQQLLLTNGFNPGPIDGIFGSRTDAAVRSFQAAKGLVVDGIVGVQTWTALGVNCETPPPPTPSPCPTLRIGSRGTDVIRLQQLLLTNGFNPGPIDGIFGSRTDAAVRAFQAARGLVVDGIVGIQTWTALGVNCQGNLVSSALINQENNLINQNMGMLPLPEIEYHSDMMECPCHECEHHHMMHGYSPEFDYFMMDSHYPYEEYHMMFNHSSKDMMSSHSSKKMKPSYHHSDMKKKPHKKLSSRQVTPCPTLRLGNRGPDVVRLQQLLLTNGFNPGPIDGIFGSRTDAAVRSFQTAKGLVVDGIVGVQTWTALGVDCQTPPPPTPGTCPTLRIGSRGPDVVRLQQLLLSNGFNPGPIDGIFGSRTDAAVRAFQAARGLVVDGIVGVQTWTALGVNCQTPPPPVMECPLLRRGSRGSQVAFLQQLLSRAGFPLVIDGIFGPNTEGAVISFQRSVNIPITGVADEATWEALGVNCQEIPPMQCPILRRGNRGSSVVMLQELINEVGFGPLAVTGYFGPRTEAAVAAIQRYARLRVTGIVDELTWNALGMQCTM